MYNRKCLFNFRTRDAVVLQVHKSPRLDISYDFQMENTLQASFTSCANCAVSALLISINGMDIVAMPLSLDDRGMSVSMCYPSRTFYQRGRFGPRFDRLSRDAAKQKLVTVNEENLHAQSMPSIAENIRQSNKQKPVLLPQ